MNKPLIALILSLFIFRNVEAQDTAIYHIKYFRPDLRDQVKIVSNRDSADYDMYLTPASVSPADEKKKIVKETYLSNNNLKLTGTATVNIYDNYASLYFDGSLTEYYLNGHPEKIINYTNGKQAGLLTEYFSNGNLYTIRKHKEDIVEKYREDHNFYLLECHDTTGKILSQGGNGSWKKLDINRHHIVEEGQVVDGLEEGEWRGYINDTVMYYRSYRKGNVLPTADTTDQIYYSADREPEFTADNITFQHFIADNIQYPRPAREAQIQGRVYVTFTIEKNGSLTNVKVLKGPEQSLKNEAERCIKLSPPWVPAIINHKPVRFQYTVPVTFNLAN